MALQVDMERKRIRMPVDIPSRGEEMLLNGLDYSASSLVPTTLSL
jgi:hypothetical protein